jgi:hypothetical protein
VHVTARGLREREPPRRRVADVVEVDGLVRPGAGDAFDRDLERPGIETDRRIPFISNLIGFASVPRKLVIRGATAAIGPPPWPLAIAVSASRCAAEARSSRMSPTVQLPWIIGPGVWSRTAKLKPSSRVLPYWPRSTRKTSPASQKPLVGRAARPDVGQGHTESQLQASQYSPLICHFTLAMTPSSLPVRPDHPPVTLHPYIE